jgi:hypothetical protein
LKAGTAPWVKPWSASPDANTPRNAVSIGLTQDATSSVVDGAGGRVSHNALSTRRPASASKFQAASIYSWRKLEEAKSICSCFSLKPLKLLALPRRIELLFSP